MTNSDLYIMLTCKRNALVVNVPLIDFKA